MKKRLCALSLVLVLFSSVSLSGCTFAESKKLVENASKLQDAYEQKQADDAAMEEAMNSPEAAKRAAAYEIPLVGVPCNYSNPDNWLNVPSEITKEIDTFYVYPTIITDTAEDAQEIVDIDNIIMRIGAYDTYEKNATAFEESTNVFAPFYRQTNMGKVADLREEELEDFHRQEQRTDIYGALDYYFENFNNGRPFILAGHSQGSILLKLAVEEYMAKHPEYYERMVAAYLIGFSVTQEDLERYPHMKFAEAADDTGVIISWNTEGPGNQNADNIVVEKGSIAINPITWTRDDTYAAASESIGSRIDDMADALEDEIARARIDVRQLEHTDKTLRDIVRDVIQNSFTTAKPGIADARLDLDRGVVICTNTDVPYMTMTDPNMPEVFGPASFHGSDYALYYYDVQQNVADRIAAWKRDHQLN